MKEFVVAISGSSGAVIGVRLVRELLNSSRVHLVVSRNACEILYQESGIDWRGADIGQRRGAVQAYFAGAPSLPALWDEHDFQSPIASGSHLTEGMFVAPCSMKTLAGIATGYAENLTQRAADVTLKEVRTLVLVPRETPLSAIHLENMLKLSRLGVRIVPPIPAFYNLPKGIDDILDFIVGRILDAARVENSLYKRWGG